MKKLMIFLSLMLSFNCFSQDPVDVFKQKRFNKNCLKDVDNLKKQNKKIKMKIENLDLDAQEFTLDKPEVFTIGKDGKRKKVRNIKSPRFFKIKNGERNGTLCLTDSGIVGNVGEFDITNNGLIIHSDEDHILETDAPIEFNTTGDVQNSPASPSPTSNIVSQAPTALLPQSVRKVYVVDFDLYVALGRNVQNCVSWAQSLHAGVVQYYEQIGITNTLFKVIVNTDTSAYFRLALPPNSVQSIPVLSKFATDYKNEPGDLIHLLTTQGYGGLAYVSGIGPTSNAKFCLSGVYTTQNIVNNYSWTLNVVAHEEGHLYGSRHTQWCGWIKTDKTIGRLDSCRAGESVAWSTGCGLFEKKSFEGTIMSYCHTNGRINLSKGFFFPQIREQMRRTLMNSGVAGGPTNNCTWTYGPWSTCFPLEPSQVSPNGNGYQTRTATPSQDICKGYPPEVTSRQCFIPTTPSQPVANFVGLYSSGYETPLEYKVYGATTGPTPVTLVDKSSGIPTSWKWEFGDGNINTSQMGFNLYANYGIYTPKLTVSNSVGTSTITKPNFIELVNPNGIPTPQFSASVLSGNSPLTVQFANESSNNSWEFIWNFLNSSGQMIGSSTSRNPSFTFVGGGVYSVSLQARNKNGFKDIVKTSYITVSGSSAIAPIANFTASSTVVNLPANPALGVAVNFTDLSTNSPTFWTWDFGNGFTSTAKNPTATYFANGSYTVKLTVTNSAGANSMIKVGYINVVPSVTPVAIFSATPLSGSAPLTVQFTDLSTNIPFAWDWDFGNGQTNSTTKNPSITYTTPGVYTVKLIATNTAGSGFATKTGYITVTNGGVIAPVTSFIGTPLSGSTPLPVQFTDNSTNNPTSWLWNFGNGQTSTSKNPTITYTTSGTYTVSLTSTNSGGSNTLTRPNYIQVNTPGVTPTVTLFKKTDGLWWIRFSTNSTQSITTNVCRYGLSPCSVITPQACGVRTSPTIVSGNNEWVMNPQPSPPSPGTWCYRVSITQGGQTYWSNFFEFVR